MEIRETREVNRAEYRHLRRQASILEAIVTMALALLFFTFFMLAGWAVL